MLKRLRSRAGLSQQTLAGRALISVQAVSALERGYRKAPYRDTLERIAKALNLSPDAWAAFEEAATRARMARRSDQGLIVPQHNLPRQWTSFLGRDEVVSEIASMTERAPLVSIVGTGGAGKTRAAVAVGAQLLDRFVDGVWFVDLAPLIGPDLVTSAAANVIGVKELGDRPLVDALTASIGSRRMVLLLDNCEHVLSGVRVLASALLRACANVRLIATSREPLGDFRRARLSIPPLAVPSERDLPTEEALLYGAVALFVDRALAVDARFSIGPRDLEAIVEICRRLDGLPLAIDSLPRGLPRCRRVNSPSGSIVPSAF